MKIELNDEQKKLLLSIGYEFDDNITFDDEKLIELEDCITDYVVENQEDNDFNNKLLALHDFIIEKYDR